MELDGTSTGEYLTFLRFTRGMVFYGRWLGGAYFGVGGILWCL